MQNTKTFRDFLKEYYTNIFPYEAFEKWINAGNPKSFPFREFAFTYYNGNFGRYRSFETINDFKKELIESVPYQINIGAIFQTRPFSKTMNSTLIPIKKELVFDIDISDYDSIRSCCEKTKICTKCWKYIVIAVRIINGTLKEDFGFEKILWVFSGRRGVHCWVSDQNVQILNDIQRTAISKYLNLIISKDLNRFLYRDDLHFRRSLSIINEYFEKNIVFEQDILGNDEKLNFFEDLVACLESESVVKSIMSSIKQIETSIERWEVFKNAVQNLKLEDNIIERIKFFYAYPRIDSNVTKGINHLLKIPFGVHKQSEKIAIPFDSEKVDSFDVANVISLRDLIEKSQVDKLNESISILNSLG